MGARFTFLIVVLALAYGYLLLHVYELQIAQGGNTLAEAQSDAFGAPLLANRGTIYLTDRLGRRTPVVLSKNFPAIYAVPSAIEDPLEAAHALAAVVGQPADELHKKLSKPDDSYELLVKKASDSLAGAVATLKIKGVYATAMPGRFYPFGSLAAQVFGFVGPSSELASETGHYGVEEFYNRELGGREGRVVGKKIIPPESGSDLFLTIDPTIQVQSERVISDLVKTHQAVGGSVIVQDPKTGKILALANAPSFDPNAYAAARLSDFLNPVVQSIYEPGSVMKVITMAAGIDSGSITPETTFFDSGVLKVSGRTIRNFENESFGKVTMTNVIERSINTGAAFAERRTGRAVFTDYLKRFGFGEKTGVDLPGEVAGDLRRLTPAAPEVAFATASFGQGVAVTQVELANAFSAIANGGVLMRPYVNESLGPKTVRRVIAPESARTLSEMMRSAVDLNKIAHIQGFSIAGKTGTAQVPDFKKGGYTNDVVNTFVGFGPVSDARFTILIRLDRPAGAKQAALTVVPAFRDLAQFILNYYAAPPDRLAEGD